MHSIGCSLSMRWLRKGWNVLCRLSCWWPFRSSTSLHKGTDKFLYHLSLISFETFAYRNGTGHFLNGQRSKPLGFGFSWVTWLEKHALIPVKSLAMISRWFTLMASTRFHLTFVAVKQQFQALFSYYADSGFPQLELIPVLQQQYVFLIDFISLHSKQSVHHMNTTIAWLD